MLAPFLVELHNCYLSTVTVPAAFKAAYVTPLLKKAGIDSADIESYRPISNLSVLSKLLEQLVACQLLEHLNTARLFPDLQSAYRAYHSTETAVVKVLADILTALDTGDIAMLTLLDLSAAFDTVDHATCCNCWRCYMVYAVTCWAGFSHISIAARSMSAVVHPLPL